MRKTDRTLSIAPMMDWTDRHCRYFHRLLAPDALLYTEMVTTGALIHGDPARFLAHSPAEYPLAIQLGGSDPRELAKCAKLAHTAGFSEVNLNVGCPSDRVQSGRFGACLMREPALVRDCLAAMIEAVPIPVTVKHRIGVDDQDTQADLDHFVDTVAVSGCDTFIVHARKAWLQGLSPKENRDVPPLDYQRVQQLSASRPELVVIVNGGLSTTAALREQLAAGLDGVMIGRAAYQNPQWLIELQAALFPDRPKGVQTGRAAIAAMRPYVEDELAKGTALKSIARHWLGLFAGAPGAKAWRRTLSQQMHCAGAGWEVVAQALAATDEIAATRVTDQPLATQ